MKASLALATMMTLLLAAPHAVAQDAKEENPEDPDNKAWVDDCPPDMMCAMNGSDEPTHSGDCGGEVCAYGDGECIECSKGLEEPVSDDGSTCMDGEQEGESCRDDVQYMAPPSRGPADGSCENCRGDAGAPEPDSGESTAAPVKADAEVESVSQKSVPAVGVGALLAALGVAGVALRRR